MAATIHIISVCINFVKCRNFLSNIVPNGSYFCAKKIIIKKIKKNEQIKNWNYDPNQILHGKLFNQKII